MTFQKLHYLLNTRGTFPYFCKNIVWRRGLQSLEARKRQEHLQDADELAPFVDSFGRVHDYLRISLTERCNLRCRYCMPAEGVALSPRGALLTRAETLRVARLCAARGVRKLRLTGGEPALRPDLLQIIEELSSIAGVESVGMTSNGVGGAARVAGWRAAGLSALTVSLDSLRPARYAELTRRPALRHALATLHAALDAGFSPVKINTVLIRDFNDDEVLDFVELTRSLDVHVRFIEWMPFAGNAWSAARMVPTRETLRAVAARHDGLAPLPRDPHATAALWAIPGHVGKLGFISSMSRPFCAGCTRLRLTADGHVKVCLHGGAELSVRGALRAGASDADVANIFRRALRSKHAQHAGMENLAQMQNRPMILIGG